MDLLLAEFLRVNKPRFGESGSGAAAAAPAERLEGGGGEVRLERPRESRRFGSSFEMSESRVPVISWASPVKKEASGQEPHHFRRQDARGVNTYLPPQCAACTTAAIS
jgi:hypothetical protein